jgi:rhodanese-related sulfurtransferase
MKNKIIGAGILLILLCATITTTGLHNHDDLSINTMNMNKEEDVLIMTITQSSNLIGVTLNIENIGSEVVYEVSWSFRYKASITGTGVFINEKIQTGIIEEINPGETISNNFIPIGLGNIYFNASVELNGLSYRTQQRAYLLIVIPIMFKDTYKDIKPAEAYERWENQEFDLIIDVVGLDIYSLGHLPGAVNYVWADGTLRSKIPELDPNWTYLVYCHTDPPSTDSAQAIVDAGITDVFRLEGNYAAWKDAGYPTET